MCSLDRFLQHMVPAHVAATNTLHISMGSFLRYSRGQLPNASFLWGFFQQLPWCGSFPWMASLSTQEECSPVNSICVKFQRTSSSSSASWLHCLQRGMDPSLGVEGEGWDLTQLCSFLGCSASVLESAAFICCNYIPWSSLFPLVSSPCLYLITLYIKICLSKLLCDFCILGELWLIHRYAILHLHQQCMRVPRAVILKSSLLTPTSECSVCLLLWSIFFSCLSVIF